MPPPGRPAPIDPPVFNFTDTSVPSTPPAWDSLNFNNIPNRSNYPVDIRIDDISDATRSTAPHAELTEIQDPLTRFYSGRDDPWIPQQSLLQYSTMPVPSQRAITSQPRPTAPDVAVFDHHSSAPSSEVGSSNAVPCRSDSGYMTKPATTRSVQSVDSGETNDLSTRFDSMRPYGGAPRHARQSINQFPTVPQPILGNAQGLPVNSLQCHHCGEIQKCRSDYKYDFGPLSHLFETDEIRKHITRHEKPHKCDVLGCTRKEGFTSANDLDRHKKSKHNITPTHGSDRSYKCAAEQCKKKVKIWPRLDNFRQHVLKIHPEENTDVLIRKSVIQNCFISEN